MELKTRQRREPSCRKERGLALHKQSQTQLEPEFRPALLTEESTQPKRRRGLFSCLQSGMKKCKAVSLSRIGSPAAPRSGQSPLENEEQPGTVLSRPSIVGRTTQMGRHHF